MTRFDSVTSATDINPWKRNADFNAALGVADFVYPVGGGSAPVSGTIYGWAFYKYAGETVSNICVCCVGLGVGTAPGTIILGLWDAVTPQCKAVTANLGSDTRWTSAGGWKECALTAPYTILANGIYYAAFLQVGAWGTTAMQLGIGSTASQVTSPIVTAGGLRRSCSLATSASGMTVGDNGSFSGVANIPAFALVV